MGVVSIDTLGRLGHVPCPLHEPEFLVLEDEVLFWRPTSLRLDFGVSPVLRLPKSRKSEAESWGKAAAPLGHWAT